MKITKNQYYQLVGVLTASHELEKKDYLLQDVFKEILGEEMADWFWEIRSEEQLEDKLKKVLKNNKVEISK